MMTTTFLTLVQATVMRAPVVNRARLRNKRKEVCLPVISLLSSKRGKRHASGAWKLSLVKLVTAQRTFKGAWLFPM